MHAEAAYDFSLDRPFRLGIASGSVPTASQRTVACEKTQGLA